MRNGTIKGGFTEYLLVEERSHLAQKLGDILTALQNLNDDASHLGIRPLIKAAKGIVNQARRVLHDKWNDTENDALKALQRVAIAIMKSIDEDGDLKDVIASSVQELEQTSGQMGEPVNQLGAEDDSTTTEM